MKKTLNQTKFTYLALRALAFTTLLFLSITSMSMRANAQSYYVRAEHINMTQSFTGDVSSEYSSKLYGDVVLRFYTDTDCQNPTTLPAGTTIYYNEYVDYYIGSNGNVPHSVTLSSTSSSVTIETGVELFDEHSEYVSWPGFWQMHHSCHSYYVVTDPIGFYGPASSYFDYMYY